MAQGAAETNRKNTKNKPGFFFLIIVREQMLWQMLLVRYYNQTGKRYVEFYFSILGQGSQYVDSFMWLRTN